MSVNPSASGEQDLTFVGLATDSCRSKVNLRNQRSQVRILSGAFSVSGFSEPFARAAWWRSRWRCVVAHLAAHGIASKSQGEGSEDTFNITLPEALEAAGLRE
jgi:hypothetical protein